MIFLMYYLFFLVWDSNRDERNSDARKKIYTEHSDVNLTITHKWGISNISI